MRKPEEIKADIDVLLTELQHSTDFYQLEFLCGSTYADDTDKVGFFNLARTRTILRALNDGLTLLFRHGVYEDVTVKMNPQRNRILCETKGNDISEDNIINFMILHPGDWFIVRELKCQHRYSKSMNQPFPRLCVICKEPEQ